MTDARVRTDDMPRSLCRTPPRRGPAGALWMAAIALAIAISQPIAAQAHQESYADLIEEISPSVVNITTTALRKQSGNQMIPQFPEGSPFRDMFRDLMGPQNESVRRTRQLGSGFIVSDEGHIITNNHVIKDASEIVVELFSGESVEAEIVGTDPNTDIALLKIETDAPLQVAEFGDSDVVRVGDRVFAIGNPFGQGFSVSSGIVSARNRALSGSFDDFIQTDASINRGNSGGPLFNIDGEVIGVNTIILSTRGAQAGSVGVGFSMASNVVADVAFQLREFGETRRGWLGVQIQDVSDEIAEAAGLDTAGGAIIARVLGKPARDAGLRVGDVIVSFEGEEVDSPRDLVAAVSRAPEGRIADIGVIRGGDPLTLQVTLGRRETAAGANPDAEDPVQEEEAENQTADHAGMVLGPLDDEARERTGVDAAIEGLVLLEVDPKSEAYAKGLREGDVFMQVNRVDLRSVEDMERVVAEAIESGRESILVLVHSRGTNQFIALPIE